jgi:hypothetical protein
LPEAHGGFANDIDPFIQWSAHMFGIRNNTIAVFVDMIFSSGFPQKRQQCSEIPFPTKSTWTAGGGLRS